MKATPELKQWATGTTCKADDLERIEIMNNALTVAEAATFLGTTRQAVNKAIAKGTLAAEPVIERGKVTRYLLDPEVVSERANARVVPDGYLNIERAANYLSCSTTTMAQYLTDGLVPHERNVIGVVSIKVSDLDAIERPKLGRPLKVVS